MTTDDEGLDDDDGDDDIHESGDGDDGVPGNQDGSSSDASDDSDGDILTVRRTDVFKVLPTSGKETDADQVCSLVFLISNPNLCLGTARGAIIETR